MNTFLLCILKSISVRSFALVAAICLYTFSPPLKASEPSSARHVILISIDAFNPDWYLSNDWPMPFLQQKARDGAHALRARPVFPSSTRPGHITLLTGWLPARHTVFNNNIPYHLEEGASIFHAVRAAGGTTAAVAWPGSRHAPLDLNVRTIDHIDFTDVPSHPSLETILGAHDKEPPAHSREYQEFITGMVRTAHIAHASMMLFDHHKPTILALRFGHTDSIQHAFGRDAPSVRAVVASVDMAIAELASAVEHAGLTDKTVFIVVGDHGMDDIRTMLRPNVWLAEAGLLSRGSPRFEIYGGSAFLRDVDVAFAQKARDALNALPESTRTKFRIIDQQELARIGADPRAAFALTATQGIAFQRDIEGDAIYSTALHGRHGSLPTPESPNNYTGFLASGPGIGPGVVMDEVGIEDVAPTIATLLGVDLGERDGRCLTAPLRRVSIP